jgi:hypothetical protein
MLMALDFDSRISAFEQLGLWLEQFLKEVEKSTLLCYNAG